MQVRAHTDSPPIDFIHFLRSSRNLSQSNLKQAEAPPTPSLAHLLFQLELKYGTHSKHNNILVDSLECLPMGLLASLRFVSKDS